MGVTLEVRLFGQVFENTDEVLCGVKCSLLREDGCIALIYGASPASDGMVFLEFYIYTKFLA